MGVRRQFTKREDEYIRQNYGRLSIGAMASILNRPKSSVQRRIQLLDLRGRPEQPRTVRNQDAVPADDSSKGIRLASLVKLRDLMEADILSDAVPMAQRASYYREYRALLAEIAELEGGADESSEVVPQSPFAQALAQLAEQQRNLLEQAAST